MDRNFFAEVIGTANAPFPPLLKYPFVIVRNKYVVRELFFIVQDLFAGNAITGMTLCIYTIQHCIFEIPVTTEVGTPTIRNSPFGYPREL